MPFQTFPFDLIILGGGKMPLHRQLTEQLRAMITHGALPAGTVLPSTRKLASDLIISRNTVTAAYEQLASEGYIKLRTRARPIIANLMTAGRVFDAGLAPTEERLSKRGRLMLDQPRQASFKEQSAFHPGTPDLAHFPFADWRRLLSRHLRHAERAVFGYYDLAGYPPLQAAIAGYLAAARGVVCDSTQVIVTTGGQAALDLAARLLLDPGDTVWMEEPGYLGAQSAFLAAGATLAPLYIDDTGWRLDLVPEPPPRVVYVTPSCQFPLGKSMRMEQRLQLIEWARTSDSWIIEDDFDSEYRFVGQPIPAMYSADKAGRTIYVGTFAKTLFPALRLGFLVLPADLGEGVKRALAVTGQYAPLLLQAALADFIAEGFFTRHLTRMRRLYARRREAFIAAISAALGHILQLVPSDAGIQTLWRLDSMLPDHALSMAAAHRRLNLAPLSRHYRFGPGENGLILGYAALSERETERALTLLKEVIADFNKGMPV